VIFFFFFQAEDGIRDFHVTGVQTCALPICAAAIGLLQLLVGGGAGDAQHFVVIALLHVGVRSAASRAGKSAAPPPVDRKCGSSAPSCGIAGPHPFSPWQRAGQCPARDSTILLLLVVLDLG